MTVPMNILLVEDNDIDAEILQRGLRKTGAPGTLVRAHDGIEALDVVKRDVSERSLPRPYVILLDINMPRMNGHEFLEAVRNDTETRDARVYVFTTSDSKRDVSLAYRNNANGYIVKPTGSRDLVGILETLQAYWSICECPD